MEDDVAKLVSPFTIDPNGGTLSIPIKGTLDPWLPTTGATAAQLLQFGKFESYGAMTANVAWGIAVIECHVEFANKF